MRTRLTDDEIRSVLARAESIHLELSTGAETDLVKRAAQESGLPIEAIEQALREQFDHADDPPNVGEIVFARSSDNRHYVAEVLERNDETYCVRFMNGGETKLSIKDLKVCRFLPGDRLTVNWPGWGWWPVSVVSYDQVTRQVKVTDGWSEKQLSVTEVRIDPPKSPLELRRAMVWKYATLIVASGAIGSLITWLLMR